MEADKDKDGKISFEEFTKMVESTDVSMSMTLGEDCAAVARLVSSSCFSPRAPYLSKTRRLSQIWVTFCNPCLTICFSLAAIAIWHDVI